MNIWAHPRVCGENFEATRREVAEKGSSPRVRGKLGTIEAARLAGWLIPACAGKTGAMDFVLGHLPAHPRVCGENRVW